MYSHQSPKISVIVPVYNVEKYLPRCIDSILSQSFTDIELLLIDDGSPDNCGKICDEYAAKDSRVRVFHKPNGGVSSARNLGLDKARGEWIVFVDSDDYVEIDYLTEMVSYANKYNVDFVSTFNNLRKYSEDEVILIVRNDLGKLFSQYELNIFCPPWGKLFRANIIGDLRFPQHVKLGEDVMFVFQYLLDVTSVLLISSTKYKYEVERTDSLSKGVNSYEMELNGKNEFYRVYDKLVANLNLDQAAIRGLGICHVYYAERTIAAIMNLPNFREKVDLLSNLDLCYYKEFKRMGTLKEGLLIFLLKNQCFRMYLFLQTLRRMMRKFV